MTGVQGVGGIGFRVESLAIYRSGTGHCSTGVWEVS